jgi:hypothetical protein
VTGLGIAGTSIQAGLGIASPSPLCRDCAAVEVEDKGDRCEGCEPRCCDQCGRPSDGKFCCPGCARAAESDRG